MPITLADASKFTQDKLTRFVIDEFRKDPIMDKLTFDDCVAMNGGSTLAYVYNRVTTLPTAAPRAINAEYVAQEAKTTQIITNLKIFGGSFEIDRVIANNVKGVADQVSFQMDQKIQATKALFADLFINGDSGVDPLQFDGLDKAVTGSSTEGNTGADIDLSTSANIDANFKTFMDSLDKWLSSLNGKADVLLVNRIMSAIFSGVARRSGSFTHAEDAFGQKIIKYNGISIVECGDKPGTANPIVPITANKTSIYAARFGLDAVHAVSPSGSPLVSIHLPNFTTAGAVKVGDVEMVAAMALKATRAAGAFRRVVVS